MDEHPLVIGHRGWPARHPENTLPGFLAAAAAADAVELDVRRSGDGKLVLAHDPLLGGLWVHSTPWRVLVDLDVGDGHHPALLDEVLAAIPDLPVQLEVKNLAGEPGFEPDHRIALEAAERARPFDIVTSFNRASIEAVRRDFDEVATGLAVVWSESPYELIRYCSDSGHSALVPASALVGDWIGDAADRGIAVYPWTVNDLDLAEELVEAGVSGIITDDPGSIAGRIRGEK